MSDRRRQDLGIKGFVVIEIITAEALAVDLIFLIEFVFQRRFEGGKLANRLCGEGAPINQKENPSSRL